ncbi:MAG: filamentous hemagglutinin N-terminal domain-containing protein, partial [Coleofasciculus sp.]
MFSTGGNEGVVAQVIPDDTLGAESSVVTPDVIREILSDRIDGGATRGANLFHSFLEFNIGEGRGVYFANPDGIENILSRVTGDNVSTILGRLGVLGEANLFLLNPNGILFGANASLDIEGSFLGTTANSFTFPDGSEFSAT